MVHSIWRNFPLSVFFNDDGYLNFTSIPSHSKLSSCFGTPRPPCKDPSSNNNLLLLPPSTRLEHTFQQPSVLQTPRIICKSYHLGGQNYQSSGAKSESLEKITNQILAKKIVDWWWILPTFIKFEMYFYI